MSCGGQARPGHKWNLGHRRQPLNLRPAGVAGTQRGQAACRGPDARCVVVRLACLLPLALAEVHRTLRISCEAVPPSASPAGAQGGTSACHTGAALSFVSCIRLFGRTAIPAVESPCPFETIQPSWCPEYPHLEDLQVAARTAPNRDGVERRCLGAATALHAWQRHEATVGPDEAHPDE
jgi:hypothetical protein